MTISRQRQLEILRKMKEEEIDYSDAPPATLTELRAALLSAIEQAKVIRSK